MHKLLNYLRICHLNVIIYIISIHYVFNVILQTLVNANSTSQTHISLLHKLNLTFSQAKFACTTYKISRY